MRLTLQGGPWLNSLPLDAEQLRGRVVLVDFWDYTCVNCLRTLPYLRAWHERYAPLGLVIVGVHTPEFDFARDPENVRQATERLGITWPVLVDSDYRNWEAFGNHYWPRHYLFDHQGRLLYDHAGEGNYGQTEAQIQQALRQAGVTAPLPPPLEPVRDTDRPGAVCYRVTPELYLGHWRGELANAGGLARDHTADYLPPTAPPLHSVWAAGRWHSARESLLAQADGPAPELGLRYQAAEVNLVLHPPPPGAGRLTLRLDGAPLPAAHAGADVDFSASGEACVEVDRPAMYGLVRSPQWGEHTLELSFATPGTAAYAFTFGSACLEPPTQP